MRKLKFSTRQSGFAPIILLVAVAALAGIGYGVYYALHHNFLMWNNTSPVVPTITPQVTQAVDETANWKMYTSTEYGYSFKYPSDLEVLNLKEVDNDPMLNVIEVSYNKTPVMTFSYFANPDNLSLQELDKKITTSPSSNSYLVPDLYSQNDEDVILDNGLSARYRARYICKPALCQRYIISSSGKVVVVTVFPNGTDDARTILSTFKFLDQKQTVDTSNWKTYTNTKYGFSLKYPTNVTVMKENSGSATRGITSVSTGIDAATLTIVTKSCEQGRTGCMRLIHIGVSDDSDELTLDQILEKDFSSSNFVLTRDFQKMIIGGESALISINGLPALEYSAGAFVVHNNKFYEITVDTYGVTSSQNDESFNLLKQIITTFKFTQ
ncbi:MAG: hypothetical protein M1607_04530 [Patescibacteria group bacterium]|nr:hypothetical protein [Patescibacteria group bacterium]